MYNDYNLEQINNKMSIVNNNLDDILQNQQTIIEYQASGDYYNQEILKQEENQTLLNGVIAMGIITLLIYQFTKGALRGG